MQATCLTTTTFERYTGEAARGKGRRKERREGERARGKFTSSSLGLWLNANERKGKEREREREEDVILAKETSSAAERSVGLARLGRAAHYGR
jgi:hypothetical protein